MASARRILRWRRSLADVGFSGRRLFSARGALRFGDIPDQSTIAAANLDTVLCSRQSVFYLSA